MRRIIKLTATSLLLHASLSSSGIAAAQAAAPYPAMAPLAQYLITDEPTEIALARSAAPPAIADAAEVMVLRATGYVTAVKGSNGFVCMVERAWAKPTTDDEFWNPKMRAPHCFNAPAARSFLPIYLFRTRLVLEGKSKAEILKLSTAALDSGKLPRLEPGTLVYMMSKQQYLSDTDSSWHPHVMFYVAGDSAKTWGANLPGSPVLAGNDPEERVTVFFVYTPTWSDGTPAPAGTHH